MHDINVNITNHNDLQGDANWLQQRCGYLTASCVKDVTKVLKTGKPAQSYFDRLNTVLAERMTGQPIETVTTKAMQWGIEHEGDARELYEVTTGNLVQCVGFIPHPTIKWLGASPDGLVSDDGLIEIKCPNTITHLDRYIKKEVPTEYQEQIILQLIVTGRKWCDYVDYDPRFIGKYEPVKLLILRFEPTEEEKQRVLTKCTEFLQDVDKRLELLEKMENQNG